MPPLKRSLIASASEADPELEAWLLKAADQPSTPLTREDFAALREPRQRSERE